MMLTLSMIQVQLRPAGRGVAVGGVLGMEGRLPEGGGMGITSDPSDPIYPAGCVNITGPSTQTPWIKQC